MNRHLIRKIGMASMAAVMILGAAGCGGNAAKSGADSKTAGGADIGFVAVLSGGAAAYGQSQKQGIDMAVDEINKSGDFKINLDMEDTKGEPTQAISVIKKMINDKKSVVIGPMLSGEMKAVGPILQQAQMPTLGISLTAEGITDMGDYIFRNSVPESMNIPQTISKSRKLLGYQKVAILYSNNNEQLVSAFRTYQEVCKKEGIDVVDIESFADKDSDFSAQLTKIQATNPDAIIVDALYQEGALILKKAREMGMNQPVIGNNGFVSPQLIKQAGAAADNVYVSSMWSLTRDDPKTQKFIKDFKERYGHDPDQFAASAYDGVYMVVDAMKRAGTTTDHKKIRDAMASMKDFHGVCGNFSFNSKRDPVVDLVLLKIENGQFNEVKM